MKKMLLLCLVIQLSGCVLFNEIGRGLENAGQGVGKVIDELKGKEK